MSPASPPGAAPPVPSRALGDARTWTCRVCDNANPVEASTCSACQTSIFDVFGAGEADTAITPRAAAAWSLLVPGWGHARAGQGLLGAAIGGVFVLSAVFGAALWQSGLSGFGVALVLTALGLYLLAALDAFRWASGQSEETLLRPVVVKTVTAVVVVVVIAAAATTFSA